ncbi:MAG: ABC transporter ATP-binding protein [Deltaproteobacteria bacterium]|nr:MAG: ABC transporter ATP-binding protein [Deltaproteobacteria bacterium]
MSDGLLEARDLHAYYGASHVLHGVDFRVRRGEIVGLMGRNGMGKTTLLRAMLGLLKPRGGRVWVRGTPMTGAEPYLVARMGIAFVPEGRGIFPNLTVRENLVMAARPGLDGRRDWTLERVLESFPRLRQRIGHGGWQLSGGEQQMLTIARTLMTNPEVLLLDEPSEGLAPLVVSLLAEMILRIRTEGVTVLLAEQNLHFCAKVADRGYVIDKGSVKYEGTMSDLLADEEVKEKYLAV